MAAVAALAVVATVGGGCGFVLPTRMMISMKPDDGAVEIFCRKIKSQGGANCLFLKYSQGFGKS